MPNRADATCSGRHDTLWRGVRQPAGMAAVTPNDVVTTSCTMVTVLPTAEVDKCLVRDVWGHGWQETWCEFEWIYRELPQGPADRIAAGGAANGHSAWTTLGATIPGIKFRRFRCRRGSRVRRQLGGWASLI